jgi:putative ABC transport system permease protein
MAGFQFLIRTAWRDSRHNRGRLILFMSSIILGVAALVAINAFNYNLTRDIDGQAASLLGADIAITGNRPLAESLLPAIDSIASQKASELELFSMAYLPERDASQFVRVRALEGDFPFYGRIKTIPPEAATEFQSGPFAIVDESAMLEHALEVGDSIRLGEASFQIIGRLTAMFGSAALTSAFAPPVYIGRAYLDDTKLVQEGSLVNYSYYLKTKEDVDADIWEEQQDNRFRAEAMRIETIAERKENLNEAFSRLNAFLNLVALVSLLMGCIGVASSVFIYVRNKIPSVAILRCLGMKGSQAFSVYFIQIVALGILGAMTGAILGSIIQMVLPVILSDLLPVAVTITLSWRAFIEGLLVGIVVTVLFALVPLLAVRKVSPMRTLRANMTGDIRERDPIRWVIYGGLTLSLVLFLWLMTGDIQAAAIYTLGLLLSATTLYLVSKAIMWLVRRYTPRGWSFAFRQGLSNLFRPNNQTQTLLVSIGLGTAVLTTLLITQGLILRNVANMDAGNQPNMILYGIERSQKDSLAAITRQYNMPVIQQVPIVTMRIEGWKGHTKAEWLADTFRDTLDVAEHLVKGEFTGNIEPGDSILISLSDEFAEALDVGIGDEVVFNVQGTLLKTYVGSLRKIEFNTMMTRFFIVFPNGVLEEAPQFQVLVTKSPDVATTARYRSEVVRTFPNVSVVDLASILVALNEILNKVSYVVRFMAIFCILTGLIVLLSSLMLSKYQRIKESVLLRTLGARRKQVLWINAVEYALLGGLSAATGIMIALVSSWLLATLQFTLDFEIQWIPVLLVFVFVTSLTLLIGLLNTREVVNKPPLEVLRKEVG